LSVRQLKTNEFGNRHHLDSKLKQNQNRLKGIIHAANSISGLGSSFKPTDRGTPESSVLADDPHLPTLRDLRKLATKNYVSQRSVESEAYSVSQQIT